MYSRGKRTVINVSILRIILRHAYKLTNKYLTFLAFWVAVFLLFDQSELQKNDRMNRKAAVQINWNKEK